MNFFRTLRSKIVYRSKFRKDKTECTAGKNAVHMLKSVTNNICDSFIITTDDGKVIVVDGGFVTETGYFIRCLKQIAGSETPHIDAWFLTHPHNDHCEVFLNIAKRHNRKVAFDKVYLNFPDADYYDGIDRWASRVLKRYYSLLPSFAEKVHVVNTGNEIDVGSAHITVLYSIDKSFSECNEGSLIFRMDLGNKSILFTGDAGVKAGNKVLSDPGYLKLLKCDICKMSHHGQSGCDKAFYEAVSPEICLWPTPYWLWNNKKGLFKTDEVKNWMKEIGVKENYISKDGTCTIML